MVAEALQVPLVIAVEALQVTEARSWGVRRPIWGNLLENRGEVQQLRRADLVTCVSSQLAEQLADAGVDASKIVVTPNMVDATRFEGLDRQAMRAAHGLDGRFVVGWVGSFRRFHALDVLLEAFALFALHHPEATLVLVGDGPERERCIEFAARLPEGQVVLPGAVAFDQVPAWVTAFDVGVVPAHAGQMFHYSPLKLQEYFAAHVPVLAPDIGQVATTIDDGANGFLCRPGDTALAHVQSVDYGTAGQLRDISMRLR
jgi:glycosyltransferase involved in cell wall biosynthesis